MRGVTAKRLRKIARGLKLEPKTSYLPGGPLRRRPDIRTELTGEIIPGPPIPRPFVMVSCLRKAMKEAKKIYKGLPATALEPKENKDSSRGAMAQSISRTRLADDNAR